MSEHVIEVVPIILEPHTNSDTLSIVHVHGWTCVVKTASWEGKTKGFYIPPDYVVDTTRPEFAWLAKPGATKHRVRVQKIRGVVSQGFLIPAPPEAVLGDNWMERLQIERYEPKMTGLSTGGEAIHGPSFHVEKYDVDNFYARDKLLVDGEEVVITEKLHGCNGRFVFSEGQFWCGSRTEWKRKDANNLWWKCLEQNDWLQVLCRTFDEHVFYGELLGVQGGFPYGRLKDEIKIRVFDVLLRGKWLDYAFVKALLGENLVPILYSGPFNRDHAISLAEGATTMPNATHIREGIVIQPYPDRIHPKYGRIKLKIVGNTYLEKS